MRKKLVIIGAGGFGKLIADLLEDNSEYEVIGFIDGNSIVGNEVYKNLKVIANDLTSNVLSFQTMYFAIAIGDNKVRYDMVSSAPSEVNWATLILKSAKVSKNATIERGVIVLTNSIVNNGSSIGEFTIVDSGVIVDHDSKVGSFCHLKPATIIGSNTSLIAFSKTDLGQIID